MAFAMSRQRCVQVLWTCFAALALSACAFRVLTTSDELASAPTAVFEPYQRGEVGYFGDPANPDPERVNEGAPFSPDKPRIQFSGTLLQRESDNSDVLSSDTPRINLNGDIYQNCPSMVGPIRDEEYYCHGRAYGYCDRRSGLCVCNIGYTGIDCSECKPSFFKQGGLCYPKKRCPNDCSQSGTCDYATGKCTCAPSRKGDDCSKIFCQFDPRCTSCTSTACRSCIEGFFVNPATQLCVSCKAYDPRCLICDAQTCLACADPLLNSVRRSGARFADAPLPFDERLREFSFTFPYGSQDPRVFDEAEAFELTTTSRTTFLNDSSRACVQGERQDATWTCTPRPVSHRVCGHVGVFSFSSPVYAIAESAATVVLTVQRSGGGYGAATVLYDIQHVTTSDSDVSPTAFYTSSQQLVFDDGVVELAFQLTIHDDHVVERDETFRVALRLPGADDTDRPGSLGNQRHALVTIVDDDALYTDASRSFVVTADTTLQKGGRAGDALTFKIQHVVGSGAARTKRAADDTSIVLVESFATASAGDDDAYDAFRVKQLASVTDNTDGTSTVTWQCTHAGRFTVAAYVLYPGGLRGDYYADAWLGFDSESGTLLPPAVSRIDRHVNFTWNDGPLFTGANDFASVRWSGRLKPVATGDVAFYVTADDHVRLWFDDVLLIDQWGYSDAYSNDFSGSVSATATLDSTRLYAIVLEYRELTGSARVQLYWSVGTSGKTIIPAAQLYAEQHIRGSPFTDIAIRPATTASVSTSGIRGVLTAIAGARHRIDIVAVDAYGNSRRTLDTTTSSNVVEARLTLTVDQSAGGIGSKQDDARITWRPEREAFEATWTPRISGIYNLDVWLHSVKLDGCPFVFTVTPGAMHATRSLVSGPGLLANRVAGVATTLLVETRDVSNNRIRTSSAATQEQLVVRADHRTQLGVIVLGTAAVDNNDGTFTLSYTPRVAGSYDLYVQLSGMDVQQSPFRLTVVPNVPLGTTSSASGVGLTTAATNVQASFLVTTRDLHENLVTAGGATIDVTLVHPIKGSTSGTCTDLRTGAYACVFTPKFVGDCTLHVVVTAAGVARPIAQSPFALTVVAGPALGTRSLAHGSGLASSIAGVRARFTVAVRDALDNPKRNAGTESVTVAFIGPAPATTAVAVEATSLIVSFVQDDTFALSYVLTTKGSYAIHVRVDGVAVASSPFSMYTYSAEASPVTTTLDLVTPTTTTPVVFVAGALIVARVTTRDAFGNPLERGGDAFQFSGVAAIQTTPLVDDGRGTYVLTLEPTKSTTIPFAPAILLRGGLNGTYFANPEVIAPSIYERLDATIDVDFGVTPPTATDAMETFSVRWAGYVRPMFSEVYTFDVGDVLGGVRLSVDGRQLLRSAWPDAAHVSLPQQQPHVALVANTFVPIEVHYTKPATMPNGRVQLRWQSASQLHEVVPSRCLFTSWRIVNNVPPLTIVPAAAVARSFTAEFAAASSIVRPPLSPDATTITATSGLTLVFRVVARDAYRNPRRSGGDKVLVVFPQLLPAETPTPIAVVDVGNGTYTVSITPIRTGAFTMVVAAVSASTSGYQSLDAVALAQFVAPFNIEQSPFTLVVQSNKPLATTSTVFGNGLVQATAGERTAFVLQLRDVHANAVSSADAGDAVRTTTTRVPWPQVLLRPVVASTPANADVVAVVTRASDEPSFGVAYTATRTGSYALLLSTDSGVTFAPKTTTLRVVPAIANALTSTIVGGDSSSSTAVSGLGPQITTNQLVTYMVVLRDVYSNEAERGVDNLVVVLRGPVTVYPTSIVSTATSAYIVAYQVALRGAYEIQTQLASRTHGLTGRYFTSTRFGVGGGANAAVQVDPLIQFDWRADETMRRFPRIRWTGFLRPKFTERYTLSLTFAPFGAVYIDGVCIIDALNTNAALPTVDGVDGPYRSAYVDLVATRLHAIAIEYRSPSSRDVTGFLTLRWASAQQRVEVVPTTALFPRADEIQPRYTVVAV